VPPAWQAALTCGHALCNGCAAHAAQALAPSGDEPRSRLCARTGARAPAAWPPRCPATAESGAPCAGFLPQAHAHLTSPDAAAALKELQRTAPLAAASALVRCVGCPRLLRLPAAMQALPQPARPQLLRCVCGALTCAGRGARGCDGAPHAGLSCAQLRSFRTFLENAAPAVDAAAESAPALAARYDAEGAAAEADATRAEIAAAAAKAPAVRFTSERLRRVRGLGAAAADAMHWHELRTAAAAAGAGAAVPDDVAAALRLAESLLAPVRAAEAARRERCARLAEHGAASAHDAADGAATRAAEAAALPGGAGAGRAQAAAREAAAASDEATEAAAAAARLAADVAPPSDRLIASATAASAHAAGAEASMHAAAASAEQAAAAAAAAPQEARAAAAAADHAAAEAATAAFINTDVRPCPTPGCGRPITKAPGGCNAMEACPACGQTFCWACLAQPYHEHSFGPCSRSGQRDAIRAALAAVMPAADVAAREAAMAAADAAARTPAAPAALGMRLWAPAAWRAGGAAPRAGGRWMDMEGGGEGAAAPSVMETAFAPLKLTADTVRALLAAGADVAAPAAMLRALLTAALLDVTAAEVADAETAGRARNAARRALDVGRAERAAAAAAWEAARVAVTAWFRVRSEPAVAADDDDTAVPKEWAPRTERGATFLAAACAAARARRRAAAEGAGAAPAAVDGEGGAEIAAALTAATAACNEAHLAIECAAAAMILPLLPAPVAQPLREPGGEAGNVERRVARLARSAVTLEEAAAPLRAAGGAAGAAAAAAEAQLPRWRQMARQARRAVGEPPAAVIGEFLPMDNPFNEPPPGFEALMVEDPFAFLLNAAPPLPPLPIGGVALDVANARPAGPDHAFAMFDDDQVPALEAAPAQEAEAPAAGAAAAVFDAAAIRAAARRARMEERIAAMQRLRNAVEADGLAPPVAIVAPPALPAEAAEDVPPVVNAMQRLHDRVHERMRRWGDERLELHRRVEVRREAQRAREAERAARDAAVREPPAQRAQRVTTEAAALRRAAARFIGALQAAAPPCSADGDGDE